MTPSQSEHDRILSILEIPGYVSVLLEIAELVLAVL
jgi:hypothetical protein